MRVIMIGLLAVLSAACAAPRASTVVSMQEVSCQSCGSGVVAALTQRPGVYGATFDADKVEVLVSYDPDTVAPEALAAVIQELGYKACVGAGKGTYTVDEADFSELDMKVLSEAGEDVDLPGNLVAGKVTVFDFFATWCGPCKKIDEAMVALLPTAPDVAYRRLNIVNWDTPLAKHHLGKAVPELPYVVIYGKDGQRLEAISGLDLVRLRAAIERGRAQ
jgi:thiol-disulfide isomerase/thioredoxin